MINNENYNSFDIYIYIYLYIFIYMESLFDIQYNYINLNFN